MRKLIVFMVMTAPMFGQAPIAKAPASATSRKPAATAKSEVDVLIELVKSGMSEQLVIKQLQRAGKVYALSTPDLLKLQKAGVTENIINVMMDPKAPVAELAKPPAVAPPPPEAAGVTPPPVPAPVPEAVAVTPYPPDLEGVPAVRKRSVVINSFDYATVKDWVSAWFGTNENVGDGIRAMLTTRMSQSKDITLLERNKLTGITDEQDRGNSSRFDQGSKAKPGRVLGADCQIFGDIVTFGKETKSTGHRAGGVVIPNWHGLGGGELSHLKKEDKAVVVIQLRIVDAETLQVIDTAEARGESVHKTGGGISLGGGGLGKAGAGIGGISSMNSANFDKTIIGEATSDAVNKMVLILEEKIPKLPPKTRKIEGRVATITPNGVYLAIGANDGVLRGDRFEILLINDVVIDPQTKDPIDIQTVKVGELVVNDARDKSAIGNYGGQPLLQAQLTGKGYAARLMTK